MASRIHFTLNGQALSVDVRADTTVLDLIRLPLALKGTKEGCAEGDCGACTVLLRREGINGGKRMAANACIMTAAQIDGAEITTVEGLKQNGVLSALQAAMAENGSSQCGFCTPGIVMAATGLLENNPAPEESDIHDALAGNLCRCTGYRPIVDAVKSAAGAKTGIAGGETERQVLPSKFVSGGVTVHRPKSLRALVKTRVDHPDAVLLAGGTDLGVGRAAYEVDWDEIITTSNVRELRRIKTSGDSHTFGAAVTWEEVLQTVKDDYPSLATLIRRFGSAQIRSMGTIGGNIGTASPIGDGPPALIALGAEIELASLEGGNRRIKLQDFFLDYRKTELRPGEVISAIHLPRPKPDEAFRVYKVSKRYDQDISTVCGAFWLKRDGSRVVDARIAFGGMAAIPKRAAVAEQTLIGAVLDPASAQEAAGKLCDDFEPLSDWRGTADYRMQVAQGLFVRLAHDLAGERVEVMA